MLYKSKKTTRAIGSTQQLAECWFCTCKISWMLLHSISLVILLTLLTKCALPACNAGTSTIHWITWSTILTLTSLQALVTITTWWTLCQNHQVNQIQSSQSNHIVSVVNRHNGNYSSFVKWGNIFLILWRIYIGPVDHGKKWFLLAVAEVVQINFVQNFNNLNQMNAVVIVITATHSQFALLRLWLLHVLNIMLKLSS